ncbi:MAG: hypothetical protein ACP5Q5_04115 [Brevinematia bacterium]|nr:hypothetical protein [Calditerrivibrio sp.]
MQFILLFIIIFVKQSLSFADIKVLSSESYIGNIGGKYKISMVLYSIEINKQTNYYGYYYYRNGIPIFVKGIMEGENFLLTEYLDNGKVNANFKGKWDEEGDLSGTWEMNKKKLPFSLVKFTPVQDVNADVIIDESIDVCLNKKYYTDNLRTKGGLLISYVKKKGYLFSFDLYSTEKQDHTGIFEDFLQLTSYYDSDPKSKNIDEKCLLFFIYFKDRIFVYEFGNPAYLDFGQGVHAEGVYLLKK